MSERRTSSGWMLLVALCAMIFADPSWAAWPDYTVLTLAKTRAYPLLRYNDFGPGESSKPDETPTHMLYSPEDFIGYSSTYINPVLTPVPVPTGTGAPLGSRIPVILVHGWQGDNSTTDPYSQLGAALSADNYWKNLIEFFNLPGLKSKYKVYLYKYPSYKRVTFNALELKYLIRQHSELANAPKIVFIAHSMGTIVTRALFEEWAFPVDKADRIILLDGVHHGSPAAIPRLDATGSNYLPKNLDTAGANDIQWDGYDGLFVSQSSLGGFTFQNMLFQKIWERSNLIATLPAYQASTRTVNFSKNIADIYTYRDSLSIPRISSSAAFDDYYRQVVDDILKQTPSQAIIDYCAPNSPRISGTYLPIFCNKPDAIWGYLQVADFKMPVIFNPWLIYLNLRYQQMPPYYKNKLFAYGAVNVNSNSSPNNRVSDTPWSFGLAEDVVQHMVSGMGYLNDGPVPLQGQLLDQLYSFDDLVPASGLGGGSSIVTMYYRPWISGNMTVYRTDPLSLGTPGTLGSGYEGDGYVKHRLFMDYNHDRMLNGCYTDSAGDLLAGIISPNPVTGPGSTTNTEILLDSFCWYKLADRVAYVNAALSGNGTMLASVFTLPTNPVDTSFPLFNSYTGIKARLSLEPLFLSIASDLIMQLPTVAATASGLFEPGQVTVVAPTLASATVTGNGEKMMLQFNLPASLLTLNSPYTGSVPRSDVTNIKISIKAADGQLLDSITPVINAATATLTVPVLNPDILAAGQGLLGDYWLTTSVNSLKVTDEGTAPANTTKFSINYSQLQSVPAAGYPYLEITVSDAAATAFDSAQHTFNANPGDSITLHARNTPTMPSFTLLTGPIQVVLRQSAGGACPLIAGVTNSDGYCFVIGTVTADGGIQFTLPQFTGAPGRFSLAAISERNVDGSAKTLVPPWSAVKMSGADVATTTPGVTSGTAPATQPLNDTGITGFTNDTQNNLATEPITHPRQDARYGRDAQAGAGKLVKIGGGSAGFDYTKIANDGSVLPETAVLGTAPTDWACTRDNVTGLIWEVKTTSGLRSQSHTYTWYDSNPATNGGAVGTASGGACFVTGRCDTEKFTADVNAAGLCGASDWRMPKVTELEGIVDFGRNFPSVDSTYFANTPSSYFWSGSPSAFSLSLAWLVGFDVGFAYDGFRGGSFGVRLVRGVCTGQQQWQGGQCVTPPLPTGYVVQGGLTWMPMISTLQLSWPAADAYCSTTTINGQTGWRLPTGTELLSLYSSGATNGLGWSFWSNMALTVDDTWSSTPGNSGNHFVVGLLSGGVRQYTDTGPTNVTCVR